MTVVQQTRTEKKENVLVAAAAVAKYAFIQRLRLISWIMQWEKMSYLGGGGGYGYVCILISAVSAQSCTSKWFMRFHRTNKNEQAVASISFRVCSNHVVIGTASFPSWVIDHPSWRDTSAVRLVCNTSRQKWHKHPGVRCFGLSVVRNLKFQWNS